MKNWYWYIIGVVVVVIVTKQCEDMSSKKFREKINVLEQKIDSIRVLKDSSQVIIDSLKKQVKHQEEISNNLRYQIHLNKKKRDEVLNSVRNYDEYKLDSILTNYRHIERTKN